MGEFDKFWDEWISTIPESEEVSSFAFGEHAFNYQQATIDKQAAEIAALRGYIIRIEDELDWDENVRNTVSSLMLTYKLIDENGNHTKLLTGEGE